MANESSQFDVSAHAPPVEEMAIRSGQFSPMADESGQLWRDPAEDTAGNTGQTVPSHSKTAGHSSQFPAGQSPANKERARAFDSSRIGGLSRSSFSGGSRSIESSQPEKSAPPSPDEVQRMRLTLQPIADKVQEPLADQHCRQILNVGRKFGLTVYQTLALAKRITSNCRKMAPGEIGHWGHIATSLRNELIPRPKYENGGAGQPSTEPEREPARHPPAAETRSGQEGLTKLDFLAGLPKEGVG